jgi:hypothetical protein
VTIKLDRGTGIDMLKPAVDCRWHSVQWQTYKVSGASLMKYRTLPHWQPPANGKGIRVSLASVYACPREIVSCFAITATQTLAM